MSNNRKFYRGVLGINGICGAAIMGATVSEIVATQGRPILQARPVAESMSWGSLTFMMVWAATSLLLTIFGDER